MTSCFKSARNVLYMERLATCVQDECLSQRLMKAMFYYWYSWAALCLSCRPFLPANFSGAAVHFSISPVRRCGCSAVGKDGKEIWSTKGEKKIWL